MARFPPPFADEDTVRTHTIIHFFLKCESVPEMTRRHILVGTIGLWESNSLTFYKTLFARMGNVKAGKFVDEETGESLNDVESTLSRVGIALRDQNGQFKDFQLVLDEVGNSWENYDSVTKHAIATAMAGVRNQEKLLVLLSNYGSALGYAATASESLGTAQQKYSAAYLDSVEAKMNALKAQFESFSQTFLNSSWVKDIIAEATVFVKTLEGLVSIGDGILVKISAIAVATTTLYAIVKRIKGLKIVTSLSKLPKLLSLAQIRIQKMGVASFITSKHTGSLFATLKGLNLDPVSVGITAATVAIVAITSAIKALDKAWQDEYNEAQKAASEHADAAAKYQSEIDALEELKQKLRDAHGSKTKLADIYEDLNKKVSVSSELLKGEERAYKSVNAQLAAQIEYNRQLLKQESNKASAELQDAYEKNHLVSSGMDVESRHMYPYMQGTSDDWDSKRFNEIYDAVRALERFEKDNIRATREISELKKELADIVSYDAIYNKMSDEQRENFYYLVNTTSQHWKDFWDAQKQTALDAYSGYISTASDNGFFKSDIMKMAVEALSRQVPDLIDMQSFLTALDEADADVARLLEDYADATQNDPDRVSAAYDAIVNKVDSMKGAMPELAQILDEILIYAGNIGSAVAGELEAIGIDTIIDNLQPGFDAYSAAMSDMSELGYLQADTLSTLIELFPTLEDELEMTANGYKIATDSLDKWIDSQREAYVAALANAKTAEEERIARENLQRFLAVEATLKMSDAIEKETKALEDQQEVLEKELDAHKKLVDIRKELLETFKEEKDYQDELEKKQRNVARLQTNLTVARLDTSAAGQARVRELEQELQEAQDDLDDFTLEHAIEVLMGQLDKEYNEHEQQVNSQISAINDAKEAITSQIGSLNLTVEELLKEYLANNPKVDDGTKPEGEFTGPPAPPPKEPIGPPAPSYFNTIDGQRTNLQNYINEHGYSSMNANAWANDKIFAEMFTSYIKSGGALDDLFDIRGLKWGVPSFHTGGFVGDIARLQSNEEFAKLLRGEFVSTPRQMDNFMRKILPEVANFGSGRVNEFNAPLISIECENVTQESLPKLQDIVNKAVATIQRQLNDGMSRSGYKQNINKKQFI